MRKKENFLWTIVNSVHTINWFPMHKQNVCGFRTWKRMKQGVKYGRRSSDKEDWPIWQPKQESLLYLCLNVAFICWSLFCLASQNIHLNISQNARVSTKHYFFRSSKTIGIVSVLGLLRHTQCSLLRKNANAQSFITIIQASQSLIYIILLCELQS